ncbi:hypothetical protein K1T71_014030 [Dendrolimus kikuchii]|uniref:Uncharacterized protein n=1 Tax=Dendrolimus kikuchii TaxID=765133 RepID=A0ACC1CEU9_9NEOP|nr:hypothetical protein K1T71_014030 [Dendrolimus kikuchii]
MKEKNSEKEKDKKKQEETNNNSGEKGLGIKKKDKEEKNKIMEEKKQDDTFFRDECTVRSKQATIDMKAFKVFVVLFVVCAMVGWAWGAPAPAGASRASGGAAGEKPAMIIATNEDKDTSMSQLRVSANRGAIAGGAESRRS